VFVRPSVRHVFTARRYASAVHAVVVCSSVRLSVWHTPVAAIVSKRLDKSSWVFLALMLPSTCGLRNSLGCFSHVKNIDLHDLHYITCPTLCRAHKEIWESPKIRALSSGTNSGLRKFHHLRQVDRVVNKTHRRQQSSLLTTSIRQSTSSGYLLQVIIVLFAQ